MNTTDCTDEHVAIIGTRVDNRGHTSLRCVTWCWCGWRSPVVTSQHRATRCRLDHLQEQHGTARRPGRGWIRTPAAGDLRWKL